MKRIYFYVLTLLLATAVSGCKLTVEIPIKLTDLLTRKNKALIGDLYVEVSSCSDYEDSRNPSKALIEVANTIPKVFKGAEYVECFRKNFDSLAHFKIPLDFRRDSLNLEKSSNINIIFSEEKVLDVGLPKSLRDNIEAMKKESLRSFDLKFNINLENDTDESLILLGLAAYFNEKPITLERLLGSPGKPIFITLSDVSVSRAMARGSVTVFRLNPPD